MSGKKDEPAEDEAPKEPEVVQDETSEEPITAEEFTERVGELVNRARDAGLRPARMMVSSYMKQGLRVVDGLLDALEGGNGEEEPPKKDGKGKKK